MYGTFLTTLTGTSIFLRKKSSELVNSKANKREGSGRYKSKTTSYLKAEHTYVAESADHAVQLRPWLCSVFPRGKIETLKQSLAFMEKSCCCFRKFSQEHSCLPIWYERQFCFTVSYSTHPSPMFSMFMKLKQDPQLLGPGHVVLHSWSRISKSFISRPHQVPHIGGGASAPEGRVEKPLPMPSCYSTNSNIETWHTITKKITTWNQDCYYEHLLTLQLHWQNEE